MKQRNFILEFAFKTKYNFFACIMAILVLIFSVSSITYAWIEGATSLTLNGAAKVYTDADAAVKLSADSATNNTLSLSSYIDPSLVCLAPASGEINETTKQIDVKFGTRPENTNDISNNYLFFEVKVKCADLVTGLAFSGSSIKINDANAENIKTGVTLLNAADRSVVTSGIYSAAEIASGVTAVDGMTDGGEYILQFKIWNEGTANAGSEVAVNLTLVTQRAATTIYLKDYTNTATADSALNGKTVRIKSGEDVINITPSKSEDNITYTFENVPDKYIKLNNLTFEAVDSNDTVYASWKNVPITKETTSYTVYGDPKKSYGTTGNVSLVTLSDASYENLLKLDGNDVTIDNGVLNGSVNESYAMRKVSDKKYTAYVPAGSVDKTVTFSNGKHSVSGTYSTTNKNYYIFGEKESSEPVKPCIGFFSSSETILTNNVQTITIRDMTTASLISNGYSVYASYPGFGSTNGDLYKAYYDTTANSWKINAYYSDTDDANKFSIDGKVWSFKATNGTNEHIWNDSNTNNKPSGKSTYYFTTANGESSTGTWEYNESGIDRDILTGAKVSFYGGIQSNWDNWDSFIYLKDTNGDNGNVIQKYSDFISLKKTFTFDNSSVTVTFSSAAFTNVTLAQYKLSHQSGWGGFLIEDNPVQGGKFYGVWNKEMNKDKLLNLPAITGATTINTKNGDTESSPVSIEQGSDKVNFVTATNGNKSVADYDLYVEYYICPKASVTDKNAYECLNPYVPTADPKGTKVENLSASAPLDLSAYAQGDYVIKTVLTDGKVYYIANVDYLTITAPRAKRNVILEAVQGGSGTAKVTYEGGEISSTSIASANASIAEGKDLTITITPDTSTKNYVFEKIEIYEGETLKYTLQKNGSTFTIPTSSTEEHPDITIKPYVKELVITKVYLYDVNGTFNSENKPQIWYWSNTKSDNSGTSIGLASNHYDNYDSRPSMELVDGFNNIWVFTFPSNCSEHNCSTANMFRFGGGNGFVYRADTTKNMYNNSTGEWTDFSLNTVTINPAENAKIEATYKGNTKTVEANGTAQTFNVISGDSITLNATPTDNTGYYDVTWTGGTGKSETNHSGSSTYAPTITADTDITVAFTNHTYKLTYTDSRIISATAEGVIGNITNGSFVPAGKTVVMTFKDTNSANNVTWKDGSDVIKAEEYVAKNTAQTCDVEMSKDRTINISTTAMSSVTVNAPSNATITVGSDTIEADGSKVFNVQTGSSLSLTAQTTDTTGGYYTYTWTGGDGKTEKNAANSTYTTTISGDTTISVALSDHTYKLTYPSGVTAVDAATLEAITDTTSYLPENTVVNLTYTNADNHYKLTWAGGDDGSSTEVLPAGTTSAVYKATMTSDRTVTLTTDKLFKVTYPTNAQFTSSSEPPVESNTTADPRYAYFKANTTNIKFTANKDDESKSYSYTWSDGSGGTGNAETFTIASLTKDVTLSLQIEEVINRKIILSNDAHARVTATYGGTTWDISSEPEKQLPPGTDIVLTVNTADGIVTGDNAALNGYKFSSVKVKVGTGPEQSLTADTSSTTDRIVTNIFSYTVPSDGTDDITITTSAVLEKFVLCGENIGNGSDWSKFIVMTGEGNPATAVTGTFTAEGTTAEFKIVELGSSDTNTNSRRDKPQYSVTINAPTLEVNGEAKTLSGTNYDTHVALQGLTSGKVVTVKYDLAANKIIVTYEVPVVTTKRIYIDTSPCTWFGNLNAHPAISYTGHSEYIYLGDQKITIDTKNYYYCDVPSDVKGITIVRRTSGGSQEWNETTIPDPDSTQNLFKVDSDFSNNGNTGTWSFLDTSGSSGGGEDSIWYLVGNLNNNEVSTGQNQFNFKTTSETDIFTLTCTFTNANGNNQYIQMYNGTNTYSPSGWDSNNTLTSGGDYSSKAGSTSGDNKWCIYAPANTTVKITWDAANSKIKYEIVS